MGYQLGGDLFCIMASSPAKGYRLSDGVLINVHGSDVDGRVFDICFD